MLHCHQCSITEAASMCMLWKYGGGAADLPAGFGGHSQLPSPSVQSWHSGCSAAALAAPPESCTHALSALGTTKQACCADAIKQGSVTFALSSNINKSISRSMYHMKRTLTLCQDVTSNCMQLYARPGASTRSCIQRSAVCRELLEYICPIDVAYRVLVRKTHVQPHRHLFCIIPATSPPLCLLEFCSPSRHASAFHVKQAHRSLGRPAS